MTNVPPTTPPVTPPTTPPSETPPAPPAEPLDAGKIGAAALTDFAKGLGYDSVADMKKAVKAAKKPAAPAKPEGDPQPVAPELYAATKSAAEANEKAVAEMLAEQIAEAAPEVKAALEALTDFDELSPGEQRRAFRQAKAMAATWKPAATPEVKAPPKPALPGHAPASGPTETIMTQGQELYAKAMKGDGKALVEFQAFKAKHPGVRFSR